MTALRLSTLYALATLLCLLMLWIAPAFAALHNPARIGFYRISGRPTLAWRMTDIGSPMRASYYGGGERLNARTASGARFVARGLTAAHRVFPFGTRLRVCLRSCVIVRVNDRGPAKWTGRSLDLSRGAAARIGLTGPGVATVRVARIGG